MSFGRFLGYFRTIAKKYAVNNFYIARFIQFIFISPQTSQYMVSIMRKNYIDGEKGHLQN
jgi:hypothetical protein